MTDLRIQLRDALRECDEERLSVDDVGALRRVVIASVRSEEGRRPHAAWLQPVTVAATVVAMVAAGMAIGARLEAPVPATDASGNTGAGTPAGGRHPAARQLQFATPGGTRIIWVFNSDLDLKTTP
jgi:hypothetical protein